MHTAVLHLSHKLFLRASYQLLPSWLQIQVRDQNGLVLGGQKVLDATITRTYATDISTFVVEGKVGTEGEGRG